MYPAIFCPSLFGPGEVISYALPAGPVPALTSNLMYLTILYLTLFSPGRGYYLYPAMSSYAMPRGPVPALTNDPAYLAILYPGLFGLGRGY